MRVSLWLLALAVANAVLASPLAAPAAVQIVIDQFAFSTPRTPVHVGDTVEWINKDVVDHTATEKNKAWNVTLAPGKSARVVMKAAGRFAYYCRFHPNMTGTLTVTAPPGK